MFESRMPLIDLLALFCFPWTSARYSRAMQGPPIFKADA